VKNHPTDYVERMRFNNLEKVEKGTNQSDKFFRNDNGHFVDISKQAGINNHGYGLAVCAADVNDDGYLDVYGCNDFAMYDYLYINQKNGTFKEESADELGKTSMFSMGVDIADVDNDGYQDIVASFLRATARMGSDPKEFASTLTVVVLAAISLHRVAFGLVLIVAFSIGLAGVISGIGLVAVGARSTFRRVSFEGRLVRALPAVSALLVLGIGLAMTARALPKLV
jgi:hypothetical protein